MSATVSVQVETHKVFPNCYRTRRRFHLRRLQVTLSAAKLGARLEP
jgi:hypothetical protein